MGATQGGTAEYVGNRQVPGSACGSYRFSRLYVAFNTNIGAQPLSAVTLRLYVQSKTGDPFTVSVWRNNWGPAAGPPGGALSTADWGAASGQVGSFSSNAASPGSYIDIALSTSALNTSGWTYFELASSHAFSTSTTFGEVVVALGASGNKPQLVLQ
jgi:hypothetical protein